MNVLSNIPKPPEMIAVEQIFLNWLKFPTDVTSYKYCIMILIFFGWVRIHIDSSILYKRLRKSLDWNQPLQKTTHNNLGILPAPNVNLLQHTPSSKEMY